MYSCNSPNPKSFPFKPMENLDSKEEHFEVNDDEEVLSMIRCNLSTLIDCDAWKRASIFHHSYIPCEVEACKLVIDGDITMNVVSEYAIARFDLKSKFYPCPFKVAWVENTTLPVKERYLVLLKLGLYLKAICCDVLPMDIAHIL